MSAEPVRKLYITLRRSFAGTRETQRKTLESLGLRYREQTVIQNNDGCTRGAISKVKHLVEVETDQAFAARKAAEAAARAAREPIRVLHPR
ncbi:hypothetical protein COCSUDRAFT_54236 [Coccomyxa subellipsoidea C-169]|uniref:Large ribosomal subunit protein uL30m n=1 Tax=Coccomyxa subellipsoidea (strain C-169) TaxID=574566 RepID=I0YQY6_COCSC|nr:hypothetical protein COCSUDRAFT_54236 [Coccomyxa subellipsoidea C-169]EIE20805.1 hypothetical protein COCSUDRAFT_54236 [Coccomyxa subellipsoidea C-169]|eukprot:XP_005645349.1 hypothetical protein COCSUDRAFT_54236 [Coccomyxa subellipsoidea C-169]